jgi:hypothetical protein
MDYTNNPHGLFGEGGTQSIRGLLVVTIDLNSFRVTA